MARGKRDDSADDGWLRRSNKSNANEIADARNTLDVAKKGYLDFCKMRDRYEGDTQSLEEQKWMAYKNAFEWAQGIGAIELDE